MWLPSLLHSCSHLARQYLSQSSAQHFIPDLVRYLCCVVHPPNEVLCSEVIPRWALIGWLLSLCQASRPLGWGEEVGG